MLLLVVRLSPLQVGRHLFAGGCSYFRIFENLSSYHQGCRATFDRMDFHCVLRKRGSSGLKWMELRCNAERQSKIDRGGAKTHARTWCGFDLTL